MKLAHLTFLALYSFSTVAYADFQAQDISCNVFESEDDMGAHPPMQEMKRAAQAGDIRLMQNYGLFHRHYAMEEAYYAYGKKGLPIPPKYKDAIVEGMTYYYIATIPPSSFREDAHSSTLFPDNSQDRYGKWDYSTPQAWIDEARANAQAWKKHCGL